MNEDFFDRIEAEDPYNFEDSEDIYGDDRETVSGEARARAARARGRGSPQTLRPRPPRPDYFPPTPSQPVNTTQVRQGFTRVGEDIQQTKAAVQHVDLENKVQLDMVARALATHGKRITGSESALAASKVVDELKVQFPDFMSNPVIETALPLLPLLLLQSDTRGNDVQSFITRPVVWGSALAAALAVFSKFSGQGQEPQEVTVTPPVAILGVAGPRTAQFTAVARDRNGKIINNLTFTWTSSDPNVATVDLDTGLVTAAGAGNATITAKEKESGKVSVGGVVIVS